MKQLPKTSPVVIIGAGPTGLTTALLLAQYGIKSVVLDQNAEPMDIPRAIILDDEGARTLQVFGAHETFVPGLNPSQGARYYADNGDCFAVTGSGPKTYGYSKRFFINQPQMEYALHDHIAASALIDMHFNVTVDGFDEQDGHIEVKAHDKDGATHTINAQYLVAADGGRSPVRESLNISMQGDTYAQDWIVIDTHNDPDDGLFSKFICSNERPHVTVPAPDGGRRYEFMLLKGETHEQVLEMDFVRELLAPFREITDADLIRKTIYTFHARIADQFRVGRVLLAGDAAHLTPPFAGQGMNAGLRDAWNISWKLATVLNGGASDTILDSYFDERKDPAWAMIQLAMVMGDMIMPVETKQMQFREQLMEALIPFPAMRDYLLQMKFKPRPRYEQGLFLDLKNQAYEGSIVGEMIPQPEVSHKGKTVLLDALLGTGFALIAQDQTGAEALAKLNETAFLGLPLGKVQLGWDNATSAQTEIPFATADGTSYGKPLRTHRDQILLIRPDRYCAAAIEPEKLEQALQGYAASFGA